MSVLNIKNFPDKLYEKLRERAKVDRRSVSQEVIHLLAETLEPRSRRPFSSFVALEGQPGSISMQLDMWPRSEILGTDRRPRWGPVGLDTAVFIYYIEEHPFYLATGGGPSLLPWMRNGWSE